MSFSSLKIFLRAEGRRPSPEAALLFDASISLRRCATARLPDVSVTFAGGLVIRS